MTRSLARVPALLSRQVMPVFTPSAIPGNQLESLTVGRSVELRAINDALKAATTSKNRPNILLVGPRGSGKSHLVAVAMHQLSLNTERSKKLAIVWLPEDVYTITTYRDLLRAMIVALGETAPGPSSPASDFEASLIRAADERVILLVAENFDRTLNLLATAGQRSLRAFQHNTGALIMLASMPSIDNKLLDHSAPFYGTFRALHLEDFTVAEARELLVRVARSNGDEALVAFLESSKGLARLRAVNHLAGGSPRLWLIVGAVMTVKLLDDLVPLYLKVLDELTPYYKARMDELAPSKAKVLATMCGLGREVSGVASVKEIAAAADMSQQTTSKLLHELERDHFVRSTKRATDKRETLYVLREPLLKHVLELKANQGESLSLLVSFLPIWYSTVELKETLSAGTPPTEVVSDALTRRAQITGRKADRSPTADIPGMNLARENGSHPLRIQLSDQGIKAKDIHQLREILLAHPGQSEVYIHFGRHVLRLSPDVRVTMSSSLISALLKLFGPHSVLS